MLSAGGASKLDRYCQSVEHFRTETKRAVEDVRCQYKKCGTRFDMEVDQSSIQLQHSSACLSNHHFCDACVELVREQNKCLVCGTYTDAKSIVPSRMINGLRQQLLELALLAQKIDGRQLISNYKLVLQNVDSKMRDSRARTKSPEKARGLKERNSVEEDQVNVMAEDRLPPNDQMENADLIPATQPYILSELRDVYTGEPISDSQELSPAKPVDGRVMWTSTQQVFDDDHHNLTPMRFEREPSPIEIAETQPPMMDDLLMEPVTDAPESDHERAQVEEVVEAPSNAAAFAMPRTPINRKSSTHKIKTPIYKSGVQTEDAPVVSASSPIPRKVMPESENPPIKDPGVSIFSLTQEIARDSFMEEEALYTPGEQSDQVAASSSKAKPKARSRPDSSGGRARSANARGTTRGRGRNQSANRKQTTGAQPEAAGRSGSRGRGRRGRAVEEVMKEENVVADEHANVEHSTQNAPKPKASRRPVRSNAARTSNSAKEAVEKEDDANIDQEEGDAQQDEDIDLDATDPPVMDEDNAETDALNITDEPNGSTTGKPTKRRASSRASSRGPSRKRRSSQKPVDGDKLGRGMSPEYPSPKYPSRTRQQTGDASRSGTPAAPEFLEPEPVADVPRRSASRASLRGLTPSPRTESPVVSASGGSHPTEEKAMTRLKSADTRKRQLSLSEGKVTAEEVMEKTAARRGGRSKTPSVVGTVGMGSTTGESDTSSSITRPVRRGRGKTPLPNADGSDDGSPVKVGKAVRARGKTSSIAGSDVASTPAGSEAGSPVKRAVRTRGKTPSIAGDDVASTPAGSDTCSPDKKPSRSRGKTPSIADSDVAPSATPTDSNLSSATNKRARSRAKTPSIVDNDAAPTTAGSGTGTSVKKPIGRSRKSPTTSTTNNKEETEAVQADATPEKKPVPVRAARGGRKPVASTEITGKPRASAVPAPLRKWQWQESPSDDFLDTPLSATGSKSTPNVSVAESTPLTSKSSTGTTRGTRQSSVAVKKERKLSLNDSGASIASRRSKSSAKNTPKLNTSAMSTAKRSSSMTSTASDFPASTKPMCILMTADVEKTIDRVLLMAMKRCENVQFVHEAMTASKDKRSSGGDTGYFCGTAPEGGTAAITHLVVQPTSATAPLTSRMSVSLLYALQLGGVWILNADWLKQCANNRDWIEEDEFEIQEISGDGQQDIRSVGAPKLARMRQPSIGLFTNSSFIMLASQKGRLGDQNCSFTVKQLVQMIEAGNATACVLPKRRLSNSNRGTVEIDHLFSRNEETCTYLVEDVPGMHQSEVDTVRTKYPSAVINTVDIGWVIEAIVTQKLPQT